ncbi:hypothetical protein X764_30750 [Mesorhizobium sp. LSHC440A00]|nr:hypothetical protein X764_30750 [Mesorhizobium sp. LSHC440A00]
MVRLRPKRTIAGSRAAAIAAGGEFDPATASLDGLLMPGPETFGRARPSFSKCTWLEPNLFDDT